MILVKTALVTAPAAESVSLDEAKAWARIDHAIDDAMIAANLIAARRWAEAFTGRQFVTATWDAFLDEFPCWEIALPKPPLASVVSIAYDDDGGSPQTLSAALYRADLRATPGEIAPAYGQSWPATRAQSNAVTIRFTAGYGAAAAVPEEIKMAIKVLVAWAYDNRAPVDASSPALGAAIALLTPYRVWTV